ncbi:Oxaloacetate decarboxylase, gamma chain [Desulfosporosinus orientis DSM 765]|uniref:Oxaloacetate decarboxylase, gamma chain n=1 Tax=Desulfosporosinus orientis (strain ATCC 19365 / DSM 765 / NCIMB 8382 / VKM B-1628 / Singapore I) TaxID=768706 RepID=G7WCU7_DESOD|nr:oxaloacetate decarboxylase subunit gamma [Desulfosporosinus orientis]AET66853.1 Oxaloacetate decarboxylase, gamma chain [Desulfosporosinus orientis DSM 765]
MSLPLVTFISGLSGVFIVMIFLQIMVNLSSKLAIALEKKNEPVQQKLNT